MKAFTVHDVFKIARFTDTPSINEQKLHENHARTHAHARARTHTHTHTHTHTQIQIFRHQCTHTVVSYFTVQDVELGTKINIL
jgi:hypothetical protein